MNAQTPIVADTVHTPNAVAEARLAARRLKAAGRRLEGFRGRRAREIGKWLARCRRANERAIVQGQYPHLSMLHSFLRDWRSTIDLECRRAA